MKYYNYFNPFQRGALQRYLDAAAITDDPYLRLRLQKQDMMQEIYARQEHQRLVEEITENVLSRLQTEVDTSQAMQQIKELQDAIDNLGK